MIKIFIEFILNHLLYFSFSDIDDIEFTGIKTGKILDFGPIGSVLLQVGQFENGYAAFEGMQDQDVLGDQCRLTLRLSMSQARISPTGEQNKEKWGFHFFRVSQPPLGRRAPGLGPREPGRPESSDRRLAAAPACPPYRSRLQARGCADSG